MKTIVYTSQISPSIANESELLTSILTVAKRKNSSLSISGAMLLMNRRFLQVLEGPIESVDTLIAAIAADTRHTDFAILFDEPITERAFAQWSMMAIDVEHPETFNDDTLIKLKNLYNRNFTFRADLFLELLTDTLRDPEMMDAMIS